MILCHFNTETNDFGGSTQPVFRIRQTQFVHSYSQRYFPGDLIRILAAPATFKKVERRKKVLKFEKKEKNIADLMFLLAPSFSKFFWIEIVDDDGDGDDCSSDEETSS